MVLVLLGLAVFVFAVAAGLFHMRLLRYRVEPSRPAEAFMLVGAALLFSAAILGFDPTHHRAGGVTAILFVGVAATGVSLVMLRWGDFPLLGPVTSAMVGVVSLALLLHMGLPSTTPIGPITTITILHITATLVGYLLFVPAFVLGNLYLGQAWRLKTKQPSSTRLPPLVTLETSAWRLLTVGFVLYTLGIVGGWLSSEHGIRELRPQHVVAASSWLVYAFALARRYAVNWSGPRAALALHAGFVLTSGAVLLYVMR